MKILNTENLTSTEQDVAAIRNIFKDSPKDVIILTDSYLKTDSETLVYVKEANELMLDEPINLVFVKEGYAIMALKSSGIVLEDMVESFWKGLLIHWWHYYGKMIYTLAEIEAFEEIISKYGTEKTLDVAVTSYIVDDGSPTVILISIRENVVEELFNSLPKFESEEQETEYKALKNGFTRKILETYQL